MKCRIENLKTINEHQINYKGITGAGVYTNNYAKFEEADTIPNQCLIVDEKQ